MSSENRLLGNIEYNKKNYEKALEYYNLAIENKEDNIHIVYSNISSIYKNLDDSESNKKLAMDNIKKSIKKNPNWEKSWFKLGELLTDNLKYEKAMKAYQRALDLNPECSHNNMIMKRIKKLEENIDTESEEEPKIILNSNTESLFNRMLKNEVIGKKMKDANFQQKILKNKSNPFIIFQDEEMMNVMKEMYKEYKKDN